MEGGRILVVDDEPQIVRVLRASLMANGYEVRTASNGEEALSIFESWVPDLVVTDLSMPRMTGAELCSSIRETSTVPIIVLSVRGEERAKVDALDRGADDYVVKPFNINELLARIRANLRRQRQETEDLDQSVTAGDFAIDLAAHRVTIRGEEVHLTPKEFELLNYMARHAGKVLTHRALLTAVWGGQNVQQIDYLRVFINTLRKKISAKYILTEPWVGYRFEPSPEDK
jgi:two-component system KDP operon response regulator KdpE